MKICRWLWIIVCLLDVKVFAQSEYNPDFIKHLSTENKPWEQWYSIQQIHDSDTKNYQLALYAIRYQHDSLFFSVPKNLFWHDTVALGRTLVELMMKPDYTKQTKKFLEDIPLSSQNARITELMGLLALAGSKNKPIPTVMPAMLQESWSKYNRAARHKPVVSMMLSAIVPGLGKWYLGKRKLALNTFITNGLLLYQSYESIQTLGVKHGLSIFNLLLASVFYAANVYGGYRDAVYFRKERLEQFYHDAHLYYSAQYYPSLYR
jgi:hypothetical protein